MAKVKKEKAVKLPLQVPFLENGSLVGYADPWKDSTNPQNAGCDVGWRKSQCFTFRDNFEFDDELEYNGYGGGRSAMSMYLKSKTTGASYPMFWKHFEGLIRKGCAAGPSFRGRWTFCKQGQNYSIKPVEVATPNVTDTAKALALAVLSGDAVAAAMLADKVAEELR